MKYTIEAINALGNTLFADVDARSRPGAIAWGEEQGLQVIACYPAKDKKPERKAVTYAQLLTREIKAFRARHGIRYRGGEWSGMTCEHKLSAAVLKRYAKLCRLQDMARGEMPWPLHCYMNIIRPTQGASWRTMNKQCGGAPWCRPKGASPEASHAY